MWTRTAVAGPGPLDAVPRELVFGARDSVQRFLVPGLLLAGWIALFGPVYWTAAHRTWTLEDQGHGPLILAVAVWLVWHLRESLDELKSAPNLLAGWPVMASGCALYLLGQALEFPIFQFLSQVFVLAGVLLLYKGWPALRTAWFPVVFLLFMVPLPGMLVDASTQSLKQWISIIVTELFHALGFPISRTGVTISVGQYQLLVADACSGLHSIYSLSALGTLYMYIMRRPSLFHNMAMLLLIIPTAFVANIVRVAILIYITYQYGEEAGRGFLHGFAGMVLLVVSLAILFGADSLLERLSPRPHPDATRGGAA